MKYQNAVEQKETGMKTIEETSKDLGHKENRSHRKVTDSQTLFDDALVDTTPKPRLSNDRRARAAGMKGRGTTTSYTPRGQSAESWIT